MIADVVSEMSYLIREFGLSEDATYSLYKALCSYHHLYVSEVSNVYFCKRDFDKKLVIRLETRRHRHYDTEVDFRQLYEMRDCDFLCAAPEPSLFTSGQSWTTLPDPPFRFTFTQHDFETEDALSYFGFSMSEATI